MKQELYKAENKGRVVWIDILRIIATWGVICIHAKGLYDFRVGTHKWIANYFLGYTVGCSVPVFLMLSGYLSLAKEVSIHTTLCKRAPRVILMKLVSLVLCAVAGLLVALAQHQNLKLGAYNAVKGWGHGTSYLAILFGCYLVAPFISLIVKDIRYERYFLTLSIIFCFIIPTIIDVNSISKKMPAVIISAIYWIDYSEVYLPVGAVFLFTLGHYLGRVSEKMSKWKATIFLFVGYSVWLLVRFLYEANPSQNSLLEGLIYGRYYGGYVSPLITIYAAGVFCFFRTVIGGISFKEKTKRIIGHLGRNSVLIFLIHGIVISIVGPLLPVFWTESFLIETIVDVTLYFFIAFLISLVLEHIPILNKIR